MPTGQSDSPWWRRPRSSGDDAGAMTPFEVMLDSSRAAALGNGSVSRPGPPPVGERDTGGDRGWAPGARGPMEQVLYEVKKAIVGQDRLLERLFVALLARGHVLVEGVPGLAKTLAVKSLAQAVSCEFQRVQFTPDLVPADLIGTRIYHQPTGEFRTSLGPVFTNLLLADEINRAPAKVQSALLEVMQERQVTIGRESRLLDEPFLVLATQNPIETEGTYALPEAQVDRFMMKVVVDYPSPTEEFVVVERMMTPADSVHSVLNTDELLAAQRDADRVYVDPALIEFAVRLANATRNPAAVGLAGLAKYVDFGVSPRGPINLVLAARALAYVRGRDYALPNDVLDLTHEVFRHRMVLSFEALAEGVTADAILDRAVGAAAVPAQVRTRA
jgi:MoxR-like ATPase